MFYEVCWNWPLWTIGGWAFGAWEPCHEGCRIFDVGPFGVAFLRGRCFVRPTDGVWDDPEEEAQ